MPPLFGSFLMFNNYHYMNINDSGLEPTGSATPPSGSMTVSCLPPDRLSVNTALLLFVLVLLLDYIIALPALCCLGYCKSTRFCTTRSKTSRLWEQETNAK